MRVRVWCLFRLVPSFLACFFCVLAFVLFVVTNNTTRGTTKAVAKSGVAVVVGV